MLISCRITLSSYAKFTMAKLMITCSGRFMGGYIIIASSLHVTPQGIQKNGCILVNKSHFCTLQNNHYS